MARVPEHLNTRFTDPPLGQLGVWLAVGQLVTLAAVRGVGICFSCRAGSHAILLTLHV